MKRNEMAGTCGMHVREERCIKDFFLWGNLKERDYSKYPGVDGRVILKYRLKI